MSRWTTHGGSAARRGVCGRTPSSAAGSRGKNQRRQLGACRVAGLLQRLVRPPPAPYRGETYRAPQPLDAIGGA